MSVSKEKRKGSASKSLKSFQQKAKTSRNYAQIYKKAKEVKANQKGLTDCDLITFLNCTPHFLGCFSDDEISKLVLKPTCFIIVNLDISLGPGSHWIALGIFPNSIEVFDSLGFDIFNWTRVPCSLLTFLHNISRSRRVFVSPRLQPDDSNMCGFYCIYYIIRRAFSPFINLTDNFDLTDFTVNDFKLQQFFQ